MIYIHFALLGNIEKVSHTQTFLYAMLDNILIWYSSNYNSVSSVLCLLCIFVVWCFLCLGTSVFGCLSSPFYLVQCHCVYPTINSNFGYLQRINNCQHSGRLENVWTFMHSAALWLLLHLQFAISLRFNLETR